MRSAQAAAVRGGDGKKLEIANCWDLTPFPARRLPTNAD
jgi:hypothetical protein